MAKSSVVGVLAGRKRRGRFFVCFLPLLEIWVFILNIIQKFGKIIEL